MGGVSCRGGRSQVRARSSDPCLTWARMVFGLTLSARSLMPQGSERGPCGHGGYSSRVQSPQSHSQPVGLSRQILTREGCRKGEPRRCWTQR